MVYYIKGKCRSKNVNQLVNYINLDWDGDKNDKKSTLCYVFHLVDLNPWDGHIGGKMFVALLTTYAKYGVVNVVK